MNEAFTRNVYREVLPAVPTRIAVGCEFFDRIRRNGSYYVDKTELIYELVHETDNAVTLITRPRRFGKTLMMSTIENFFDIRKDSRSLFAGLDVSKHEDFCATWMNQYPVLSITFKDAAGLTFDSAYGMLEGTIASVCKKHDYLADSDAVNPFDRDVFLRLCAQTGTESDVKNCLLTLTRMMHAHYGKPAILLIDEYDVPLAKANEEKECGERYYPQMLDVIRKIMGTALKSNEDLMFAVVTGCLRIAKESIFTGVNNFASYSVLDEDFSHYFGFTQREVDDLLTTTNREEKADTLKKWYDGYTFGNDALYCPWDVVNYVAALLKRADAEPKNYWKNTSENGIIKDFVGREDFQLTPKFEALMNGGTIMQTISDELTYDTLHETEDNLWSVLTMTGYLTKADSLEHGDTVSLRIPNKEVEGIFEDAVIRHFSEHVDRAEFTHLMTAFWNGDVSTASEALSDFLWQTISYRDYHEDYYHAFLAGLFSGRGYSVDSNKEHGLGRPDILLTDYNNRRALIIEAKKSSSAEQMEQDCDRALRQIVDQGYAKGLQAYQVHSYGIAFFQKSAKVKKR